MVRKLASALAAIVIVAFSAVACGEEKRDAVRSIALLAPGASHDVDWSRHARTAVEDIAEQRKLAGLIAGDVEPRQVRPAFRQLAAEGADLVFAHDPAYARAAAAGARDTEIPALVWGDRDLATPRLVGVVEIDAAHAGFVVGVLTAHASTVKKLAVLITEDGTGWDRTTWNVMAGGFIAGVRNELPGADVSVHWVGGADGATVAEVERAAAKLLDRGINTLFTLGRETAIGALKAVDADPGEEVYAGVIGDKASVSTGNSVVAAVLYDFGVVYRKAIADVRAGRFGERPYRLTFANGGLHLLQTGRTPSDAYEAALAAQERLSEGALQVPDTPTRADVLALLNER